MLLWTYIDMSLMFPPVWRFSNICVALTHTKAHTPTPNVSLHHSNTPIFMGTVHTATPHPSHTHTHTHTEHTHTHTKHTLRTIWWRLQGSFSNTETNFEAVKEHLNASGDCFLQKAPFNYNSSLWNKVPPLKHTHTGNSHQGTWNKLWKGIV